MVEPDNDRYTRMASVEPVSVAYERSLSFRGAEYTVLVRDNGVALVIGSIGWLVFISCGLPAGRTFGGSESSRAFSRILVVEIDALIAEGRATVSPRSRQSTTQ